MDRPITAIIALEDILYTTRKDNLLLLNLNELMGIIYKIDALASTALKKLEKNHDESSI